VRKRQNDKMSRIFIDGSGWNGKNSRYAIASENGYHYIHKSRKKMTNNEMEYLALLHALEVCENNAIILTDSRLVVGQVCQNWKVKAENLFTHVQKAKNITSEKNVHLEWIPRGKNLAGHLLEKR